MFRDDPNLVFAQQELESARQQGNRFGEFFALARFAEIFSSMAEVAESQNQEEWRKQNWQHAVDYFQQARSIARELGDEKRELGMEIGFENAQWRLDGGDSSFYYESALSIARQKSNLKRERILLLIFSHEFESKHDRANALEYNRQALAVSRKIGDKQLLIDDLWMLGAHYMGMESEDYVSAIPCYEEALTLAESLTPPEPLTKAGILSAFGYAYSYHDLTKSIKLYEEAISILRETGSQTYALISNLNDLARLYVRTSLENQQKALSLFEEAFHLTCTTSEKQAVLYQLMNTSFALSTVNHQLALDYARQALDLARRSGDHNSVVDALRAIATLFSRAGKVTEELSVLEEALVVTRQNNNLMSESQILARLSGINKQLGHAKEATAYSKQSLLLRAQTNDFFSQISLAKIYEDEGDFAPALEYSQKALEHFIERKNQAPDDQTQQSFDYWMKRAQERIDSIHLKMG